MQLENTYEDATSMYAVLFLVCVMSLFTQIPSIPLFCDLRAVHVFQINSHYYYRPVFYLSFLAIDTLYTIPESFIQCLILHSLSNMRSYVLSGPFCFYWLCILISHITNRAITLTITSILSNKLSGKSIWKWRMEEVLPFFFDDKKGESSPLLIFIFYSISLPILNGQKKKGPSPSLFLQNF